MRQQAPIVLSSAALVVAVLGTTPLGHAAGERLTAAVPFAKRAGFAKIAGNSAKLNGRRSALSGTPGTIPVVGKDGKLPASLGAVGPQGARGPQGERGPQGLPGTAGAGSGGGRPSGAAGGALTGSYPNPEIAPSSIGAAQVVDNSLTGGDINESTLAQVPSALLGGLGGTNANRRECDPGTAFGTCVDVTVDLPARTRVLVLGRITGTRRDGSSDRADGVCRLAAGATALAGTSTWLVLPRVAVSTSLIGVTPLVGPGPVTFRIDCNSDINKFRIGYTDAVIATVALSPS
jgi:hypothetical protein